MDARRWMFALAAIGVLAFYALTQPRRPPRRRGNPWRTLSNRRRVFIDDEGRLERGLPADWRGAHVRDLPELGRRWRGIDREERACTQVGRARATFSTTEEAVQELLDANPELLAFLQLEGKGRNERSYLEWLRRGRRGRKPELGAGDGRFDALNEGLERKGRNRVSSWHEAVRAVVPPSRRWADFDQRLELLEDATGLRLNLPGPAEDLEVQAEGRDQCYAAGDRLRDDLVERARGGRLTETELADVPF